MAYQCYEKKLDYERLILPLKTKTLIKKGIYHGKAFMETIGGKDKKFKHVQIYAVYKPKVRD